jgi:hypothetical protein
MNFMEMVGPPGHEPKGIWPRHASPSPSLAFLRERLKWSNQTGHLEKSDNTQNEVRNDKEDEKELHGRI